MHDLPLISHPNLLLGLDRPDDAGIYRLTDDMAIIQTIDFFTPIVDDPYSFGQVAVANALSDVYAMGGTPLSAMNVVCFPTKTMDISILREILIGGLDKMREAEVVLVGGHSVEDPELKYGLSVTGIIHPDKVVTSSGAKAGDRLILTKPLGTGIINTAVKGEMADEELIARSINYMSTLNRKAAEAMMSVGVNACTDITGFGFLGHACEMIEETNVGLVVHASAIPFFPEVQELVEMGMVPGGLYRNRDFRMSMVDVDINVPEWKKDVMFDPQTSGGLLMAVSSDKADALLRNLRNAGVEDAVVVGEVVSTHKGRIVVK